MAKRIDDNGADVPHTASEAGLLRSAITLGAYLDQSALTVVSGTHRFPTNSTAGGTDVKTRITLVNML